MSHPDADADTAWKEELMRIVEEKIDAKVSEALQPLEVKLDNV